LDKNGSKSQSQALPSLKNKIKYKNIKNKKPKNRPPQNRFQNSTSPKNNFFGKKM